MWLPASDVPLPLRKGTAQASGFLPLKCFKHSNYCYLFSSHSPFSSLPLQKEKLKPSGSRTLVCPTSSGTVPRRMTTSCCSPPWPRPRRPRCSGGWTPTPGLGGGRTSIPCVMCETFLEWSALRYVDLVGTYWKAPLRCGSWLGFLDLGLLSFPNRWLHLLSWNEAETVEVLHPGCSDEKSLQNLQIHELPRDCWKTSV